MANHVTCRLLQPDIGQYIENRTDHPFKNNRTFIQNR